MPNSFYFLTLFYKIWRLTFFLLPIISFIYTYSFECKNQERVKLWRALAQALGNAGARAPVLVLKRNHSETYAVIELLKRRHEIENFNKKALYILIREMTNIETSHITKVVNVFKKEYKYLLNEFENKGIIEDKKNKFFH